MRISDIFLVILAGSILFLVWRSYDVASKEKAVIECIRENTTIRRDFEKEFYEFRVEANKRIENIEDIIDMLGVQIKNRK